MDPSLDPRAPHWTTVVLAIMTPVEAVVLGAVFWALRTVTSYMVKANQLLAVHTAWIAGHEKHTDNQNSRMDGIENRERDRAEERALRLGWSKSSVPRQEE